MYYPNQKQITIHRDTVKKSSKRVYLCVYADNLIEACKVLSHTAFKTYVFLLTNRDNYYYEYSPTVISKATNLSLETIRKNFRELEEKKFIIAADGSKTQYDFYEVHRPNIKFEIERRMFVDSDTGEIYSLTYDELTNIVGDNTAKIMWEGAKNESKTDEL